MSLKEVPSKTNRLFKVGSDRVARYHTPHTPPILELLESKPFETHTMGILKKPSTNIQTQSHYSTKSKLLIILAFTCIMYFLAPPIWVDKSFPGVWYSKSSGFCATQPGLVVQKCTTQAMGPERPGAWKNGETNAGNKGVWERRIYPQENGGS